MREGDISAAIIGVGLMGGSLAGALKQTGKFREVVGVDVNETTLAQAQQKGFIDRGETDVHVAASQADLIILATPVRHIIRLLKDLGPDLKEGTLVMDIGSTKAKVVAAMNQLPSTIEAIGGHPMTGAMTAGVSGANPIMFHNRTFILTPTQRSSDETVAWLQDLLKSIGANVIIMDAERHDQNTAIISHLPRFLPIPLIALATKSGDDMTMQLAAGGFRAMTSGAAENPNMWTDVVLTNPDNLIAAIRGLQGHLDELVKTIETGDESSIRSMMNDAQLQWEKRYG